MPPSQHLVASGPARPSWSKGQSQRWFWTHVYTRTLPGAQHRKPALASTWASATCCAALGFTCSCTRAD